MFHFKNLSIAAVKYYATKMKNSLLIVTYEEEAVSSNCE